MYTVIAVHLSFGHDSYMELSVELLYVTQKRDFGFSGGQLQ